MACHRRRLLGAVRIGVVLHQRRVVPLYVVALLIVVVFTRVLIVGRGRIARLNSDA